MAKSYSEYDRHKNVLEPNLTRQRLPYKGPIPSTVLNLYYDQFMMDYNILMSNANKVLDKVDGLIRDYANNFNLATPDFYADDSIEATMYKNHIYYDRQADSYAIGSSTPYYYDALEFNKYAINSGKISLLNSKISILEDLIAKKE